MTPRPARVAFAKLDLAEHSIVPADWTAALRTSLVPGAFVERYNRRWRMGQHRVRKHRWLYGTMGFESLTADTTIWDDERKDWTSIRSGQVAPFAIDLEKHRVAFELRSSTIRPGTFQGNFQALLTKASSWAWRVRLEGLEQEPWEEWERRVDRITKLTIKLRLPNPHFAPQDKLIEQTFEEGKLKALQIGVSGEDVDPEGPELLKQAFTEVDRGYGDFSAEGVEDGQKQRWSSKDEEVGVKKDDAQRDPDTGHVPNQELQRLLAEQAEKDE